MDHPSPVVESRHAQSAAPPWSPGRWVAAEARALDAGLVTTAGGILHPRCTRPWLRLRSRDPRRFHLATPFHEFSGDLGAGVVVQGLRAPGGGPGPTLCHSGNMLEWRAGGRHLSLDAEAAIAAFGILRQPGRVTLWHESLFHAPAGPFGTARRPVARLRHDYAVTADSPVVQLTVTLTAEPGARLIEPRLTTALDNMSPAGGPAFRRALVWTEDAAGRREAEPRPAEAGAVTLHAGRARHLAFPAEGPAEGAGTGDAAPACHLRLLDGARLRSVKGSLREDGTALHWAVLRYGAARLDPGETLVIREERLLVAGDAPGATPEAEEPPPPPRPGAALPGEALSRGGWAGLGLGGGLPAPVFLGDRVLAWTHAGRRIYLVPDDLDLTPALLEHGLWEAHVEAALARLLRPGMVAAEVGANIGYHLLRIAESVGPAGRVHAFEADPRLIGLLRATIAVNGFAGRVALHGAAALDREGEVVLAAAEAHHGSGHVLAGPPAPRDAARYPRRTTVPATTLDAALAEVPALDLLRMDVEGSEPLVLRGAEALIARSPRLRILAEWSVPMMAARADVSGMLEWLEARGFRGFLVEPGGGFRPLAREALLLLPHSDVLFAREAPGGA